jgi:biotin carboxyl carrier protein
MVSGFIKKDAQNKKESFNQIKSPLFGKVVGIKVKAKQEVKRGDVLIIIESMKTENNILATGKGVIDDIFVSEGSQVAENSALLKLSPIE